MNRPTKLNTPTVLITGAAIRLGKATAQAFFERGCNLVLHYNQSDLAAKALNQQFNQLRPNSSIAISADLSVLQDCKGLIVQALEVFGRLDHLVNNASIFYPTPLNLNDKTDLGQLNQFMNINCVSPIKLIQLTAEELKKNKGSVINLIDIYADAGLTEHGFYVASKAALKTATLELALELAPDIRVNGVSPGAILWPDLKDSDKNPTPHNQPITQSAKQKAIIENTALKHPGHPKNIAATVCYLALDASYTTGSVIKVDGGRRWYI